MADHVAPDAKTKKYDRQLRIWGTHGQEALESARVCLLNCGPTGTETLKNLVLGGIAAFTAVDGSKVEASDLGNNFMLDENSLYRSKAECTTEFVKELNDAVEGSFVEEDPEQLLATNPDFFKDFTLVVATQMREPSLVLLDSVCRVHNVKLVIARSYGLAGYLRVSLGEHTVIESKPDNVAEDLRLHKPWPELKEYADSFNLAALDDITHKHVPYAVLLIQAAAAWAAEHGGAMPSNAKERAEFKTLLKSGIRVEDGFPLEEDNFNEAVSNAHKMWAPPGFPSEVTAILEDECANVTASSSDFWVLVAGLKAFVANEGAGNLPLEGSIPDMTATTEMYLQLQHIYHEKANADIAAVEAHVHAALQRVRRDPHAISKANIRAFCKNARNIRLVRYRTIAEETGPDTCRSDVLKQALGAEDMAANASLYILLRAVDSFHRQYNRYPGIFPGDAEEDVPLLKTVASKLLGRAGVNSGPILDDLVGEIARFGAGELHCVAAVMGGMAAQEAIKLLTRQFVPLQGTLIYNAMASTTSVFSL